MIISGETGVFLHPFEHGKIFTGQKTAIFFHKKVTGLTEPGNLNVLTAGLRSAIREISELIY